MIRNAGAADIIVAVATKFDEPANEIAMLSFGASRCGDDTDQGYAYLPETLTGAHDGDRCMKLAFGYNAFWQAGRENYPDQITARGLLDQTMLGAINSVVNGDFSDHFAKPSA